MNPRKMVIGLITVVIIVAVSLFIIFLIMRQPDGSLLKVGTKIPEFSLPDQSGKIFDIKDVVGKKNLVIYFYPRDESPGCTKEACSFRDHYNDFTQADAMVIGISSQSTVSHAAFIDKYKLPFTLLSDEDNIVHEMFGVVSSSNSLVPGRVTFVVDKTGTIIYTFNSQTEPEKHVREALRILTGDH